MDGPRRAIVVNVVVPLAAYYGLRALGAGQWLALAIGALPPLLWTGYTVAVRRRADALALFALSILALSLLVSLLSGSPRFLLAKDGWLTAAGGLWILATLPRTPFYFQAVRALTPAAMRERAETEWRRSAAFRRTMRVASTIWGAGLVLDAVVRVALAYTLPVDRVPLISGLQYAVVFAALELSSQLYIRRQGGADMTTVVLITGGAGGIGAAVARRFARAGARVVVADTDEVRGRAVAAEVGGLFVAADVTREEDSRAAVEAAMSAYGRLDVVHLNAGTGGAGEDLDPARYRSTLAVNLDGTLYGLRAALPVLAASGGGAVVVTSSLAGIAPAPFDPVYSASKHALIGLVRSLAPAWAESGVTINAICPGFVDTPLIAGIRDAIAEHGFAIADPDEVAAAVETIAGDGGTGQAWTLQAGHPPQPVTFPAVDLARAG